MVKQLEALSSDDFFAGFLAGLTLSSASALSGSRTAMNRAFHRAVQRAAGFVNLEKLGVDYDSLYSLSPWFDRALTRAQRDLLIGFPNPSYDTVEIQLEADEAEEILREVGHRDEFMALAQTFLKNLQAA